VEPDIDLRILQVYGTGTDKTDGAVSHSFIELYNNSDSDLVLTGYSIQYSTGGTEWVKLDLEGTIKAKCSFLILGKRQNTAPRLDIPDNHADQIWDITLSNKSFKVCLVQDTGLLTAVNPFDTDGQGARAEGYIDLFGSIDNDKSDGVTIDGFETEYADYLSKQKSARRKTLDDTDNNKNDFEAVDYRIDKGMTDEMLVYYGPKNTTYDQWNPAAVPPPVDAPPEPNAYLQFNASDADSGIPVLKIDTAGQSILGKNVYVPGSFTQKLVFDWYSGVKYALYDETGGKLLEGETEMKGRGNSTWNLDKKPYALKLASKTSVLGMPRHKRWALLANHYDRTLLRTEVAIKLGNIFDKMAWTPRSQQAAFFLNGAYQGAYEIIENIKLDENRVNVAEITLENPSGGYILEIDERKGEDFNFTTTRGVIFCCSDPDDGLDAVIPGETKTLFAKIQTSVQAAEDALFSANFANSETGYRKYLDVDSFIDWYFVNEITKNPDAIFYSSVYMYYDPVKQKYCMGPIWDFDLSLGNAVGAPSSSYSSAATGFYIKNAVNTTSGGGWGWPGGTVTQRNWMYRLFEDPSFVSQVKARWNEKRADLDTLSGFVDQRAAYLDKSQALNFKKWDVLGRTFSGVLKPTGTYAGHISYMKEFLLQRINWLDNNIKGL
jgi:hypothetical protein